MGMAKNDSMFDAALLKQTIGNIPDFPKPGILFRDIAPVFAQPDVFAMVVDEMVRRVAAQPVDLLATIDARGFLLSASVAYACHKPMVLIRKQGKLPGQTFAVEYDLEYGTNTLEIQDNAVAAGSRVMLIDDLIATGGTLMAACDLLQQCQAKVTHVMALIDLPFLQGATLLRQRAVEVDTLIAY